MNRTEEQQSEMLQEQIKRRRKRGVLIEQFFEDPQCKVFLSTDAGGVGLNLQAASMVVNLDLPWNPAVLAQRRGRRRIHRHHP